MRAAKNVRLCPPERPGGPAPRPLDPCGKRGGEAAAVPVVRRASGRGRIGAGPGAAARAAGGFADGASKPAGADAAAVRPETRPRGVVGLGASEEPTATATGSPVTGAVPVGPRSSSSAGDGDGLDSVERGEAGDERAVPAAGVERMEDGASRVTEASDVEALTEAPVAVVVSAAAEADPDPVSATAPACADPAGVDAVADAETPVGCAEAFT
jgi:hypothetical protein